MLKYRYTYFYFVYIYISWDICVIRTCLGYKCACVCVGEVVMSQSSAFGSLLFPTYTHYRISTAPGISMPSLLRWLPSVYLQPRALSAGCQWHSYSPYGIFPCIPFMGQGFYKPAHLHWEELTWSGVLWTSPSTPRGTHMKWCFMNQLIHTEKNPHGGWGAHNLSLCADFAAFHPQCGGCLLQAPRRKSTLEKRAWIQMLYLPSVATSTEGHQLNTWEFLKKGLLKSLCCTPFR